MDRTLGCNLLVVAVRAGVVVRVGNIRVILIVVLSATRLEVVGVKMIDPAERPEVTEAKPKVLMVAGGHDASAPFAELNNRIAFRLGKAVAGVDGHQPQLIEVRLGQPRDPVIVAVLIQHFISRNYLVSVSDERLAQKGKARNIPVVLGKRYRRL